MIRLTRRLQPIYGLFILILAIPYGYKSSIALSMAVVAPIPAVPESLSLEQLKITGDEFVILQNNAPDAIKDLGSFSLKNAGGDLQQLPALSLAAGARLLLSASPRPTCGAAIAGKLNLSLVDSGGSLAIIPTHSPAGTTSVIVDRVAWGNAPGAQIANITGSAKVRTATYYRYANEDSFKWQLAFQDPDADCQLVVALAGNNGAVNVPVPTSGLISATDTAPATIVTADAPSSLPVNGSMSLPEADAGLIIPEITELLPNPNGSGNDATDEYVELYNPNAVAFDLTGFKLQSGTTLLHDFTFSSGASLPAKGFVTYYSADTGLSLSNSGGRVKLLDPMGRVVVASELYGTARDGQAWALANGQWYWSLTPTPGLANTVTLPAAPYKPADRAKTGAEKVSPSKTPAVHQPASKSARTTKPPKIAATKKVKPAKPKPITVTPTASSVTARPIQAGVVALVATIAVLYGAYEYRADLANAIYKLRRKFGAGGADR